jgi:hypothetical protein
MSKQNAFSGILNQLQKAEDGDSTQLGDIVEAFNSRGFGPLLLVPSFLIIIPIIGGIPGASVLGAAIIFLISVQMLVGRSSPWIPQKLRSIEFDGDKLDKATRKTKPYAQWLDKYTGNRLTVLTQKPSIRIIAVICILLAGLMLPMAVVPMGVALPAAVMIFFALGLTVNDGLLLAIGYVFAAIVLIGGFYWWLGGN